MNIDGDNWKYEKIYSGNCFGIINVNNKIIFVDEMKGIVEMDKNFNIKNTFKLQKGIRPHGIAYHKEKKVLPLLYRVRSNKNIQSKIYRG